MERSRIQHRFYIVGVVLKGIDGMVELLTSGILLFSSNAYLKRIADSIANDELTEEPNNHLAAHFQHAANQLSKGSQHFAVLYLAGHGAIKIALVVGLWRHWRWSYAMALIAISLMIAYQIWRLAHSPSYVLGFLTAVDAAILFLIWREWRSQSTGSRLSMQQK